MLSESVGEMAPPTASLRCGFEVAVCDLKAASSSVASWNMKSSGKRSRLSQSVGLAQLSDARSERLEELLLVPSHRKVGTATEMGSGARCHVPC